MTDAWVKGYLEKKKANFRFVEHEAVLKPVDSAKARKVSLSQIAKALLYIADDVPVLFFLPGDMHVDEDTAKKSIGAKQLRLAEKNEVKKHTNCEVGLVPPTIEKIRKIIDPSLFVNREVSFNAGIPTAGIIIPIDELLKVLDNHEKKSISKDRETVIGLEIHIELNTKTKLFCGCPTHGSDTPNSRTCVVCLGHPGSKPVLNKKAVEYALKICLAAECEISPKLIFSRKSYFYPDMAKNYQITQYEIPLGSEGRIRLKSGREIGLTRIHMEEDPASIVHVNGMQKSPFVLVDYNRSGNPLCEIVTKPEIESANEAREFLKQLIEVISYLEVFDETNGIIKADANISIKESGYTRVEIKNITGFKEIERALNYEIARQKQVVSEKGKIVQETRGWDSGLGMTFSLRTKETEEDYGYILDPDLTVTEIADDWLSEIKGQMPELSHSKVEKFVSVHKLKREDAQIIAAERKLAELFEKVAEEVDPLLAAKWLRRELVRVLNYNKKSIGDLEIDETHLISLLKLVEERKITETTGQKIMELLAEGPLDVEKYVKDNDLIAVSDAGELRKFCQQAVEENLKAVEEYKAGNDKSFNFLVGQVMRKTKGKASPKEVNDLLKEMMG